MSTRLATIGLAALVAAVLTAGAALAAMSFNTIGDEARIIGAGHQVQAAVLLGCTEGERVRFHVTVTDADGTVGSGQGAARCTGEAEAHEVTVAVTGGGVFDLGPADADAWAETRHGQHTHPRHTWSETITLVE